MNLTRRSLFASAVAPVVVGADSLTNFFKTIYAPVDYISETAHFRCFYTVTFEELSKYKREPEPFIKKYYYRSCLHRDHPTLDCLVSPLGNPTKYSSISLIQEAGYEVFWYYSAKLENNVHKDPYGTYRVYLPVNICNKYKLTILDDSYITHLS